MMILFKKIIAIIVAAVCFMQGINVIAQSTTEIINISADDKCISWDYSGDDYKGANVYLLDKNNTLLLQGTTTDTAYTCSSNGNYVVRAYSSSGESKGKIITVTDEVPFEVSLDGCKYNNGYITYEVRVSNISSAYASGIVAVRAVDADGNTTRYTYSKVTLEPGKEEAFRTSFKISDDTETIAVCVWDSKIAQNLLSNEILNVCRDNIAGNLVSTLNAQAEELSVLIEKCENQGITTDYEEINYNVIKMFSGYVQEDLENGDIDRIEYTKRTTNQLYVDAKENLEAYLAGEKKPLSVPKYVTSDVAVKSKAMYAMTDNNGVKEERPVFFVGYCGHEMAIRDLSSFDELGTNSIQMEVGPASLMSNGNKWEFYYANNPDADYMLSDGPDEASKSIKVVYNSEILSNRFFSMSQTLSVQGGTTYVVSGKVKSENAESFCLSPNNYYNRFVFDTGTYDWKDFSFEYTVPSGVSSTILRFMVDGPTDGVYLSELSMKDKNGGSSAQNVIVDGSFTAFGNPDSFVFDAECQKMKDIEAAFEAAEENNIAVSLLISPHYFFDDVIYANNIEHTNPGSFMPYNINATVAKEIMEKYLRNLIPLIKDYKSLNNICLSNEINFSVGCLSDFYSEDWIKFLEDKYNDINTLNGVYSTAYTDFDKVPLEYEIADYTNVAAPTLDYMEFNNMVVGEWHKFMADIIHEFAPDIPVQAKILGWIGSSRYPEGFFRGTGLEAFYENMDLNGCDYVNYIDDRKRHLSKELWYDFMLSYKNAPVVDTEDHIIRDNSYELYTDDISDYTKQVIYQEAIHGRAMSDIWVWGRSMNNTAYRDSILYRPDVLAAVGYATNDLNRLSKEIVALQETTPEVGILYNDSNMIFNSSLSAEVMYEAYEAAAFNGKKASFIHDINPESIHDYKVVIVPYSIYISDEMLTELYKYVQNGGEVVILEHILGYGGKVFNRDENGIKRTDTEIGDYIRNNSTVVPFNSSFYELTNMTSEEFCTIVRQALINADAYDVSIIDMQTGKPAHNIEYNIGTYDGKLIVNLSNYGKKKNVKVYFDGVHVTNALELISNTPESEIIELDEFEVKTLNTNIER